MKGYFRPKRRINIPKRPQRKMNNIRAVDQRVSFKKKSKNHKTTAIKTHLTVLAEY